MESHLSYEIRTSTSIIVQAYSEVCMHSIADQ